MDSYKLTCWFGDKPEWYLSARMRVYWSFSGGRRAKKPREQKHRNRWKSVGVADECAIKDGYYRPSHNMFIFDVSDAGISNRCGETEHGVRSRQGREQDAEKSSHRPTRKVGPTRSKSETIDAPLIFSVVQLWSRIFFHWINNKIIIHWITNRLFEVWYHRLHS